MLRVMLVDDEPLALEGLALLIPWQTEGFSICASCQCAPDALALIPQCAPDLIVTDIRMPGMDGLAFLKAARSLEFTGEFLIVSGYADFEYAQQALRIGVAGFLLKPIDPAEAASALEHVRCQLIEREATRSEARGDTLRCLSALLGGQEGTAPLPVGFRWRIASWGAPLPFSDVRDVLATYPDHAASTHIVGDKEYLVTRWPAAAPEPSAHRAEALLQAWGRALCDEAPLDNPAQLPQARYRLDLRLNGDRQTLDAQVQALAHTIALRQPDAFRRQCATLQRLCASRGADAIHQARHALVAACVGLFSDKQESLARLLSRQDDPLEVIGETAIELLAPTQESLRDRVADYVLPRLGERLTLEKVAGALGYHPTYLGRVFREEQGRGFREWLGDCRMERAAELLKTTATSVCVIAESIGYPQYKRFLLHFKRRYGLTPGAYRTRHAKA